ncbi:TPA: hypothetical protein ACX6RT_003691 [Photobacterium damselae]
MKFILENIFHIDININNFWLSNIGYHISKNAYSVAFKFGLYFLIKIKNYNYYSLVRGNNTLNMLIDIGYKQVTDARIENKEKVYLCRANVLKVISNPMILNELSDFFKKEDKIDSYFDEDVHNKYFSD